MSTILEQLRLASLRAKGYTAQQIAEIAAATEEAIAPFQQHMNSPHAPASAEENVIVSIKKNGIAVPPVDKIVDIKVPTKTSELLNDSDFATTAEIESAVSSSGHLKKQVVDVLPQTTAADPNTIYYLRKNSGETGDQYTEYQLINGAFELVGAKAPDLTPYATLAAVAKADNALIEGIVSSKTASKEAYIGAENLALFWSLVQPLLGGADLTDLSSRVKLLELVVFNQQVEGNPFTVTFDTLTGVSATGVWNTQSQRIEF